MKQSERTKQNSQQRIGTFSGTQEKRQKTVVAQTGPVCPGSRRNSVAPGQVFPSSTTVGRSARSWTHTHPTIIQRFIFSVNFSLWRRKEPKYEAIKKVNRRSRALLTLAKEFFKSFSLFGPFRSKPRCNQTNNATQKSRNVPGRAGPVHHHRRGLFLSRKKNKI